MEPGRGWLRVEGNATGIRIGVIDTIGARAPTTRTEQRTVCAVGQTVGLFISIIVLSRSVGGAGGRIVLSCLIQCASGY